MALTTLDLKTALIVIDLQKGVVTLPLAHPADQVVARAKALIDAFRARKLPVVLVNATGRAPGRTEQPPPRNMGALPEGWTDLIPELDPQPDDLLVTKRTWGAFATTDLEQRLKALGVTQVVVVGIATTGGVEATARQAYEVGFNVTLAVDAMTDARSEAHDYCVRNVFPRLGETGTAAEVIALLG
jgi:nicotinamidase-related amidase